ncbi:hypothetical protein D3C71_2007780 [compost metagenome]
MQHTAGLDIVETRKNVPLFGGRCFKQLEGDIGVCGKYHTVERLNVALFSLDQPAATGVLAHLTYRAGKAHPRAE